MKTAILGFAAAALLATTSAYAGDPAPGDATFGRCVKTGVVTPGKNGSFNDGPNVGPGFIGPLAPFEAAERGTAIKNKVENQLPFKGVVECDKPD